MDPIKEAFFKIKREMFELKSETSELKNELNSFKYKLNEIREALIKICEIVNERDLAKGQFYSQINPTHKQIITTHDQDNPTDRQIFKPLKAQDWHISTGNQGVPTDRQTNQQTDRQTQKGGLNTKFPTNSTNFSVPIPLTIMRPLNNQTPHLNNQTIQQTGNKFNDFSEQGSIENVARMLDSLDSLKKEIRLKFKQLTDKEVLVFSTLYQIEEEQGLVDYKILASKLNLTESSIRDYIGRLLKKGIPIEKTKLNNKNIQLSVSKDLKKIASLSTILQLLEL